MRARFLLASIFFASIGCSALIGTRDLSYDENASDGGTSSSGGSSGTGSSSGSSGGDGGPGDGSVTCNADLMTDKANCGRCGHGCGGGDCTAGKCQPVQISSVGNAPLEFIGASADSIFVSTAISLSTQTGGLWRIPKNGGAAELYVTLRYAENMRVVGDTLFFVVDDTPGDGGVDQTGGLYTCPTKGPAPCAPTRIASADSPHTITVDGARVIFQDTAIGMRSFDTGNSQTTTLNDYTAGRFIFVDGTAAFYNVTIFNSQPYTARMIEVIPDGGFEIRYDYTKNNANAGTLIGTKDALYVTAFDWEGATTGGVVHRYPRTGGLPCDYGGTSNKRPFGVAVDAQRIYWTNLGVGTSEPFTGGSLATCDLAGCCTTPDTLWTGDGEPGGIALDEAFVYWVTENDGGVWKIAKP